MTRAAGYLDAIVARKRAELAQVPPAAAEASELAPVRPFAAKLRAAVGLAVIAEVKRRSPVKGDLAPDLDLPRLVQMYEAGGAAACSVLTDSGFSGTLDDLRSARAVSDLPLLRKDFLLEPGQCAEARAAGADAVLLIAAVLEGSLLAEMLAAAEQAGVEALVEVHDSTELERALAAGAHLVGVNNRDLQTFEVHLETSLSLARQLPPEVVRVSESGIAGVADARKVAEAGYDAVLVGEALVRSPDPAALVAELSSCG